MTLSECIENQKSKLNFFQKRLAKILEEQLQGDDTVKIVFTAAINGKSYFFAVTNDKIIGVSKLLFVVDTFTLNREKITAVSSGSGVTGTVKIQSSGGVIEMKYLNRIEIFLLVKELS